MIEKDFLPSKKKAYRMNRMRRKKMLTCVALFVATALLSCKQPSAQSGFDLEGTLAWCHSQVTGTLAELKAADGGSINYSLTPRNIADGDTLWHRRTVSAEEWCAGFFPGILWMDGMLSGDEEVLGEARAFSEAVSPMAHQPAYDHDLGFIMLGSQGKGWEATGDSTYLQLLLEAADTLATLFNPTVGTILSWPRHVNDFGGHNTIVDNLINLELLFIAAAHSGDSFLYDMAVSHADVTMQHQFLPDGTNCHVAIYDTLSGQFIRACTHQGYADGTMWARGQAWAIYGYTMIYRYTHEERFLRHACLCADHWLQRVPSDGVPYWDFDDPAIPDAPRDASAAAIVADALLELCRYVPATDGERYHAAATTALATLSSDPYRCTNGAHALLRHCVGNKPAGSEIDYSINYGDYYYLEALGRMKKS